MDERPQFDARFMLGVEPIDTEHRQLFGIAAEVHDSLGGGVEAETLIRASAMKLLDYTATHFVSEEALMERAGYPELEAHRQLHRRLLSQARDMGMRADAGDDYAPVEMSRFIYRWLMEHIDIADRRFAQFISARP